MAKIPQVVIVGSGIAGLSCALKFARIAKVLLVTKEDPMEGATRYAQGGIASVWSKSDSFAQHIQDTVDAGAGLCRQKIVEICVQEGPDRVQELIDLGVQFTRQNPGSGTGDYDLHREGGHRKRRILHADDLTGMAIEQALFNKVKATPQIQIMDHTSGIDLITEGKGLRKRGWTGRCIGIHVLDGKSQKVKTLGADLVVLATGGAGKVYLYTTNPDTATGDGIAMAYRAGARIANMEFMQFHPTCLYHPQAKNFLISEALRGEGAILRNQKGEAFMERYHPLMQNLAPRDIVARAIDMELKRTGDRFVYLDATGISSDILKSHFPHITKTCAQYGIDLCREPIPVVPAMHYTCGGVLTDESAKTSIPGLYAVGEVACTGLHGANRLASNSLLEGVVFAERAFESGKQYLSETLNRSVLPAPLPEWSSGQAVPLEEQMDIAVLWKEIRTLMWNYVGIVRSDRRLRCAVRRLENLRQEVNSFYWEYLLTKDLVELRNLVTVAELIAQCALQRRESRGLHTNVDFPEKNDALFLKDSIV